MRWVFTAVLNRAREATFHGSEGSSRVGSRAADCPDPHGGEVGRSNGGVEGGDRSEGTGGARDLQKFR